MNHINGKKTFKKKGITEAFICTECHEELPTRKAREIHRRKVHSISLKIRQRSLLAR